MIYQDGGADDGRLLFKAVTAEGMFPQVLFAGLLPAVIIAPLIGVRAFPVQLLAALGEMFRAVAAPIFCEVGAAGLPAGTPRFNRHNR